MTMLGRRLLSAAILLPALLVTVLLGDPWYSLAVGLIAALATLEFYRMMSRGGHRPLRVTGVAFSLLFVASGYLAAQGRGDWAGVVLTGAALVPLLGLLARPSAQGAATDWALTLAGSLYAGWLLSYFILLRNVPQGASWVLLAVLSTFSCDSAAYLVGQAWGKHKLMPHLSPGKTWEGAAAGFVAAVVASALLTFLFNSLIPLLEVALGLPQSLALGALVGVLAQVGDLAESLLKRSVQVKDAGDLIPGHGGLLDRLDSLLFSVVAVYFYSRWLLS